MAKSILDIGRWFYLIEKGDKVKYQKYCEFEMSPENFVIIVNNA